MKQAVTRYAVEFTIKLIIVAFFLRTSGAYAEGDEKFILKKKEAITIEGKEHVLLRGEIRVREDRAKQGSRFLTIPVQIIKALHPTKAEPIFWLDGGPGATNILSIEKIVSASPAKLLANHDFVCVGYRGVDGATILRSKKINKAFRGLNHAMLSDESLNNIELKIKAYCSDLKKEGVDINQYTILNVIDDMDFTRKALGYESINLLSLSYGTRVALLYSHKYPDAIKRILMVGACPPGYFLTRPEQAENTIDFYDSLYKTSGADYQGSIRVAMLKAFKNLPKKWATFRLDPDKIKAGTTAMLYARGSAVWAFNAYFKAAYKNDYSELYMLQKIYEMNSSSVIGDIYAKTVSADMDPHEIELTRQQFRNSSTILGNNVSMIYGSTARAWSINSIPAEYQKSKMTNSEIVIISGDLDFRTPANITEKELMPFLKNGRHIVLKNMSHVDIQLNVMKSQDFLFQFFDSGKADSSLINSVKDVNFTSQSKLGKMKIFIAGLIL